MVDPHVLLLTFPSHGSINPSLQFAKQLIRMGVKVTIVTSIFGQRRMAKTTDLHLEGLTLAAFSDGYDEGSKNKDHFHFISEFQSRGSHAIAELIRDSAKAGHPVTRLVYNMNLTWAAEVAQDLHIPSAVLWTQPATVFDIYHYYFHGYGDAIRENCDDPSFSIQLPGLPMFTSRDLPSLLFPKDICSFALPTFKQQIDELGAETNPKILINSFDALEPEALRAIENYNLTAIGPLVPSPFLDGKDDLLQKSRDYVDWLDSNSKSSVVYVSFGSVVELSKQQLEQIVRGLLKCHRPFLWVIRETSNGEKPEDGLSCRDELEQQGMIVPWCSQAEVLSHPSLGCFVTHCGWNSSLESLVSGIPMVGFPQFADQMTNAKLIEDVWKIGVRVVTNEERIVTGDEIKRCIEMVMGSGDERGEEIRRNAKKWKDLAREAVKDGGSSNLNFKSFVDEIGDNIPKVLCCGKE